MADALLSDKDARQLADLLADDLAALQSNAPSASSMAVQLKSQIRAALARGVTYRQIANVFAARGLRAEPDTIRIAVNRNVVTKAARARKNKLMAPTQQMAAFQSAARGVQQPSQVENHRRGPNLAPRLK